MTRAPRKLGFSVASALAATAVLCAPAAARTLVEAQQELAAARNRYFQAIHAKPNRTGDDEAKLYSEIVAPAEANLNQAVGDSLKSAGAKLFKVVPRSKDAPAPKTSGTPKPEPSAAPEVVLDGSKVPKELEFSGKPKKKKPHHSP